MKNFLFILILGSLNLFSFGAMAASENFGDYSVYYQAVNSTFLDADIARQYGIVRSDRRAFLNISVLKNSDDGSSAAVSAQVSGGKRNLLGQTGEIDFREIQEGQAIYYIGEFDYSNAEIVRFRLEVSPEGSDISHEISWETRMYNN
ncbi:MAG: hypothetical protein ACI934_000277 [Pseudohongiellaceae bacterium]|jgi:hypothetical protein|tara:strand:+ start:836 stop:1276 length:441 start_codon:yes stop_codon:yes gene_type:complete